MEGGVGRGGRRWGKEGGLEWRFEGGFGQVQGSLERWEGRGRWGRGEGGVEVRGGFKAERGRGRGRDVWFECKVVVQVLCHGGIAKGDRAIQVSPS